jgi:hexosaminidase
MLMAPALLLAAAAALPASSPQVPLSLRWELKEDVFDGARSASRAAFTLTNRGPKPWPGAGWAVYFDALHSARAGTVSQGFRIEEVVGGWQRLVPGAAFAGLEPGASVTVEYETGLLTNRSFAPVGPYVVFDSEPDVGHPIDSVATPFVRFPQGAGRDPRVVTPEAQYALDTAVRDIAPSELPLVFPTPVRETRGVGVLTLRAMPAIDAGPGLEAEAQVAAQVLRPSFPKGRAAAAAPLRLAIGAVEGQPSPEAYALSIDAQQGIRIVGASPAGVFYGLQTLRGLLPPSATRGQLVLPALTVVDAPRFAYRGLMLDVARNFQPKATVLSVIDLLARAKLNVLHLHLTEDENWRIEIESLPELVSVGARRGHTLDESRFLPPAYGSGPVVDRPWGSGFYSRADYREILQYAAARHIEVVPEIEMPGHARAAIVAMEARFREKTKAGQGEQAARYRLREPEDRSTYTSAQFYHDNVMNPALESTYAFVERVVAELAEMHREAGVSLRHLHVGGDEVPAGVWEGSPAAQALVRTKGLGSVDDLWFEFYARVEQILKAHGLSLAGWEEIALRKTRRNGQPAMIPNPGFANRGLRAYVWNNVPGWGSEDLAYRLANGGFEVVLCPVTNLYLDMAPNPNPEERGLDWGGYVDLRKVFQFIPYDYYRNLRVDRRGLPLDPAVFVGKDRLTDFGKANVVGLQANLWSETLGGEGRLESTLVPKLFGLAERDWAPDPDWARESDPAKSEALERVAWSRFANVVGKQLLPRLAREQPGFAYRIPTPGLRAEGGEVRASLELPGFTLRYTTDGTEPTVRSPEVRGPIPFRGTVRVAAFDANGRRGHAAALAP